MRALLFVSLFSILAGCGQHKESAVPFVPKGNEHEQEAQALIKEWESWSIVLHHLEPMARESVNEIRGLRSLAQPMCAQFGTVDTRPLEAYAKASELAARVVEDLRATLMIDEVGDVGFSLASYGRDFHIERFKALGELNGFLRERNHFCFGTRDV